MCGLSGLMNSTMSGSKKDLRRLRLWLSELNIAIKLSTILRQSDLNKIVVFTTNSSTYTFSNSLSEFLTNSVNLFTKDLCTYSGLGWNQILIKIVINLSTFCSAYQAETRLSFPGKPRALCLHWFEFFRDVSEDVVNLVRTESILLLPEGKYYFIAITRLCKRIQFRCKRHLLDSLCT